LNTARNGSITAFVPAIRNCSEWSGLTDNDERYLRVRDKAVAMIPHLLDDYGMPADEAERYRKALLVPRLIDAAWNRDEAQIASLMSSWR